MTGQSFGKPPCKSLGCVALPPCVCVPLSGCPVDASACTPSGDGDANSEVSERKRKEKATATETEEEAKEKEREKRERRKV